MKQLKRWSTATFFLLLPFIIKAQIITTFAGGGGVLHDGAPATSVGIADPNAGSFDKYGNCYFASDLGGNRVIKVNPFGIMYIFAGTGSGGFSRDYGPATAAELYGPTDAKLDTLGNLYISDHQNLRIRKVNGLTGIITTIAGTGTYGYSGEGIAATASMIWADDVAVDKPGNVYIADYDGRRVQKVNPAGIISTIAGTGIIGYTGDGDPATDAELNPISLAFDTSGDLFIADPEANVVRKINTSGIISTIAGNGSPAYTGDGIPATDAPIQPTFVATDLFGNLFIADKYNNMVYKVDAAGILHHVAGSGITGITGDGGPATAAALNYAGPIFTDPCGNLYISEPGNALVRKVTFNPITAITAAPTISISASPSDTVCSGTSVTYHATVTSGGTSFMYQWYVNGIAMSATGTSYTYIPANGDSLVCKVSTVNLCSLPATASSNTVYMVVNPVITPAISIAASPSDTVCAGTSVTYHATVTAGGTTPAYQWYINGVVVSAASSYTYTPASGDSIRCVFTGSAECATLTTASSGTINMVVNPVVIPAISIVASPSDTVCAGTSVTYTASIIGGGSTPAYQWYVNGVAVISGSSSYTYTPANGDVVSCTLTSSNPCAIPLSATNSMVMVVRPVVTPTISISLVPADSIICSGTPVAYTASVSNGGSPPGYLWKVNGVAVDTTPSYTYTPANGDSIRCILTSSAECAVPSTTSSSTINMVVDTFITPTITLSGITSYPIGSTVTVNATVADAGSSYLIHWFNNGIEFATTTIPTVTYTKDAAADTITALIVPTGYRCYDSATSAGFIVTAAQTGVKPLTPKGEPSIWPNPAKDELHIDYGANSIMSVVISNLLGQELISKEYNTGQVKINIATLPAGVYVLKVNNYFVQKLVKE